MNGINHQVGIATAASGLAARTPAVAAEPAGQPAHPSERPSEHKADRLSAGRVVRQVLNVAAHAVVLAGKGLHKLAEGAVLVARRFGDLVTALKDEYRAQQARSDRALAARQARHSPPDGSTHHTRAAGAFQRLVGSAGSSMPPAGGTGQGRPADSAPRAVEGPPRAAGRDAAHRAAAVKDAREARRIDNLPSPPTGQPGSSRGDASRPYRDFEHSGSSLSGRPLDPKWQAEVAALQQRLDALKSRDGT